LTVSFLLEHFIQMAIKIIMGIFIIVLLFTSYYMWHNRNDHFLIYNTDNNPKFTIILTWTSIALLFESILGVLLLFLTNKYMNLITLLLSTLTILIFSLLINQKND
jgi:uncharacterized membrane protein YfcA